MNKIILKCAASYTTRIEFVYSDSQTFGYCYDCSLSTTYVKNFTLAMSNKELYSLGFQSGLNVIIDALEICVKDQTTSDVTCMKGCDTTRIIDKKYFFNDYNVVSFVGFFDPNFNSLAHFGLQYLSIN